MTANVLIYRNEEVAIAKTLSGVLQLITNRVQHNSCCTVLRLTLHNCRTEAKFLYEAMWTCGMSNMSPAIKT